MRNIIIQIEPIWVEILGLAFLIYIHEPKKLVNRFKIYLCLHVYQNKYQIDFIHWIFFFE